MREIKVYDDMTQLDLHDIFYGDGTASEYPINDKRSYIGSSQKVPYSNRYIDKNRTQT